MSLTPDQIVAWTAVGAIGTCFGAFFAWRHYRLQNQLSQLKGPFVTAEIGLLNQSGWCKLLIEVRNIEDRGLDIIEVEAIAPGRMRLLPSEWAYQKASQPWEMPDLKDPLPIATHRVISLEERLEAAGKRHGGRKTANFDIFAYCPPSKYFVYRPKMIRLVFRWRDERARYFAVRAKVLPARLRD